MRLGAKTWVPGAWCLGIGCIAVAFAFHLRQNHLDAAARLRDWPKAEGRVVRVDRFQRMSQDGSPRHDERATVTFQKTDGTPAEGWLFGNGHAPGEAVILRYDPGLPYKPRLAHEGWVVRLEKDVADDASGRNLWAAAATFLAGIGLSAYGGRGLYRYWKTRPPKHVPSDAGLADAGVVADGADVSAGGAAHSARGASLAAGAAGSAAIRAPRAPILPGGVWKPPPDLTAHDGAPLAADADFFVPPPPEIGTVLSAHTTLRRHEDAFPFAARVALIGSLVLLPAGAVWWVLRGRYAVDTVQGVVLLSVFVATFGVCLAILLTRFSHTVTYVGELGVSRHRLERGRHHPPKDELFLFNAATDLVASLTTNPHTGAQHYDFEWKDKSGRRVHRLEGSFWGSFGTRNTYAYARAAENAWSTYRLAQLAPDLRLKGYLQFNFPGGDWVRVGRGFIEFCGNGAVERCDAADIQTFSLKDGRFTIASHGAGRFSGRGKYAFDYEHLANAGTFVLAVRQISGLFFGVEEKAGK